MLVPSAPTLTLLPRDVAYRSAVAACDFAIVDSAYLALLWWLIHRKRLHRVSGLEFVRAFLHETSAKQPGALFLVNPTENDGCANMNFLRSHGFELNEADCYAAPIYRSNDVADPVLLSVLSRRRPRYVMLNIGGGTQEPLGAYLKRNLEYAPGIICTGAAIAFLTGRQATIPEWVDHMGLGWLARTMGDPRRFLKR
jgi:UDP-N-acetyl-D-mannosaminuronic acid transferase (WecB/TagA/CpsF family)